MVLLILLLVFFLNYSPILSSDNNIFGLHLTQTSDIDKTHEIINSQGGDWGWVTIVIRLDQLNHQTWQEFFDKCRKYHIIPIIRLSTIMDSGSWKSPSFSDIDSLANFLQSLNWPTKQKHIILFNEINHATEWGGETNVKNYTDIAIYSINKFKSLDSDYFIMGSALDLAAPEKPPQFKSASSIYREIYQYKSEYFQLIDGLASHSYPNHGYVGLPTDTGQHSIKGYQWEHSFINNLGVQKTYPVFITETGWPHRQGEKNNNQYYTTETTSKFLVDAINMWSKDTRVKAVTPFIFNYPYEPFDHFSWVDTSENMYPEYQRVVSMPKPANKPAQKTSYSVVNNFITLLIFSNSEYGGQIILKNTGQSIWGETEFCLAPKASANITLEAICTQSKRTMPGEIQVFNYKFSINEKSDNTYISWENLPEFKISPVVNTGRIYSPKLSIQEKIVQLFQGLFL